MHGQQEGADGGGHREELRHQHVGDSHSHQKAYSTSSKGWKSLIN